MKDFKPYIGRTVHLVMEDVTLSGTLVRVGSATFTLEHARAQAAGFESKPVDGVAIVPAAGVMWVQVV